MTDESLRPIDYATPVMKRKPWILKWILFGLAAIMSLASMDVSWDNRGGLAGNSAGGAAAGLWIAFALIYVHEGKSSQG